MLGDMIERERREERKQETEEGTENLPYRYLGIMDYPIRYSWFSRVSWIHGFVQYIHVDRCMDIQRYICIISSTL